MNSDYNLFAKDILSYLEDDGFLIYTDFMKIGNDDTFYTSIVRKKYMPQSILINTSFEFKLVKDYIVDLISHFSNCNVYRFELFTNTGNITKKKDVRYTMSDIKSGSYDNEIVWSINIFFNEKL